MNIILLGISEKTSKEKESIAFFKTKKILRKLKKLRIADWVMGRHQVDTIDVDQVMLSFKKDLPPDCADIGRDEQGQYLYVKNREKIVRPATAYLMEKMQMFRNTSVLEMGRIYIAFKMTDGEMLNDIVTITQIGCETGDEDKAADAQKIARDLKTLNYDKLAEKLVDSREMQAFFSCILGDDGHLTCVCFATDESECVVPLVSFLHSCEEGRKYYFDKAVFAKARYSATNCRSDCYNSAAQ